MRKLTASIVVYKSNVKLLKDAVSSFVNAAPDSDLYIIDNSPTDEARVLGNGANIRYVFNGWNMGFGAAHNLALKEAMKTGSKYHLVLNPDVYFEASVVHRLTDFMDQNQDAGLVMPKVLYPDGRLQHLCRLLPSPSILLLRRLLHPFKGFHKKLNHYYEMQFTGYDRVMDVPFLSGCFMFLRVDALHHTGLFDERIFLYTEDVDLTRRMHLQYRTVFFPDAVIYHHHVRESYKSFRTMFHHATSAAAYFNKWGWFVDTERDSINRQAILKVAQANR